MQSREKIAENYILKRWKIEIEFARPEGELSLSEYKLERKVIDEKIDEIRHQLAEENDISYEQLLEILKLEEADRGGIPGTKFYDLVQKQSFKRRARVNDLESEKREKREAERRIAIRELGYDPDPEPQMIPTFWKIVMIIPIVLFLGYCGNIMIKESEHQDCVRDVRNGDIWQAQYCN